MHKPNKQTSIKTKRLFFLSESQRKSVDRKSLIIGSKKIMLLSFALILVSLGTTITILNSSKKSKAAAPVYVAGYESGKFTEWTAACQFVGFNSACSSYGNNKYSMLAQTAVKREGNYGGKFELHDGDTQAGSNERTEVTADYGSINANEGNDMWYAWSTQFSQTFPATHSWGLVSQFKSGGGSSPPMGIYVDHGTNLFGLTVNTYSDTTNFTSKKIWSTTTTRDVWHDIKLHVKWSASDSGFVELWHNGVQQTFSGVCAGQKTCYIRTLRPGGGPNYYKQGYYRDVNVSGVGIVYHDGFRVANSNDDLGAPYSTGTPPPTTPTQPTTPTTPTTPPPTTPPATAQTPYGGTAKAIPGKIESEDYDNGGEGVAYHDTTTTNQGGKYRTDGVDVETSSDGGFNVGYNDIGEWREHTVNTTAGTYNISARVSSAVTGGKLVIKLDSQTLGTIDVPNTGGWQTYQTVNLNNISIPAGTNKILRFETSTNYYTINWVNFDKQASTPPVTPPTTPTTPTTPPPPIEVPNSNPNTPVEIPKGLPKQNDGTLIADFNGDGLNDVAKDNNNDNKIDPKTEIVVDGKNNEQLTDTSQSPVSVSDYTAMIRSGESSTENSSSDMLNIKAGPLPEAKVSKKVAYGFIAYEGAGIAGFGAYLAAVKLGLIVLIKRRMFGHQ